jgi:hypothetical protein
VAEAAGHKELLEMVVLVVAVLGLLEMQHQQHLEQLIQVVVAGEQAITELPQLLVQAAPVWSSSKCQVPLLQPSQVV